MKISCPDCAKSLTVGDDFGGRRVKCPGCQTVFRVPAATPIPVVPAAEFETEVSDRPLPAKKSAAPPPIAVKTGAPPTKAGRKSCPECGAKLVADDSECPECDWTAKRD